MTFAVALAAFAVGLALGIQIERHAVEPFVPIDQKPDRDPIR